jgi:hypothetical protein
MPQQELIRLNKILVVCISTALLVSCNKSDEQTISEAKKAVQTKVENDYGRNMCASAKILARVSSESDVLENCDRDFKPSAGLTFSNVRVYHHKDSAAVCGIVSGRTDISRIGARFVYYVESGNTYVFMQTSKYRSTPASKKSVNLVREMVNADIAERCQ